MKTQNYLLYLVLLTNLLLPDNTYSQSIPFFSDTSYKDTLPNEFDEYMQSEFMRVTSHLTAKVNESHMEAVKALLVHRMKKGFYVSQKSIDVAIRITQPYSRKVSLIDTLLISLYKQAEIRTFLLNEKAFYIYHDLYPMDSQSPKYDAYRKGVLSKTLDAYLKGINAFESLTLMNNLQMSMMYLQAGELMLDLGDEDKESIESHFYRSLDYAHFKWKGGKYSRKFFDNYVSATLGLINSRRGDLEKLQQIRFVGAAYSRIVPLLSLYLEELGVPYDDEHFFGPSTNNSDPLIKGSRE